MQSPSFALPDDKHVAITEFSLTESPQFQTLGNVQLRLGTVSKDRRSFDLTVRMRGREFYRQDVKVNEPIKLARNTGESAEVVVGAIGDNRVWGYLSEPIAARPAATQPKHRRHRRHR